MASTVVRHLELHPFVHADLPKDVGPAHTVWMVQQVPSWLGRLFGATVVTVIVEVRPGVTRPILWPTGNDAPTWAVEAIEQGQDGSFERTRPPLQLPPAMTPRIVLVTDDEVHTVESAIAASRER